MLAFANLACFVYPRQDDSIQTLQAQRGEVNKELANTRSAKKALRVAQRRRMYNKPIRSRVKTLINKAERLIALHSEQAAAAVRAAISALDKAAEKGVIHKNNAARRKSRLMKKFNSMALA